MTYTDIIDSLKEAEVAWCGENGVFQYVLLPNLQSDDSWDTTRSPTY